MLFKNPFKKKTSRKIIVTITDNTDGSTTTNIAMDSRIKVTDAAEVIDRIKANIRFGLTERCKREPAHHRHGIGHAQFVKTLTVGNIIKTKFKY